jgi:hypothetical protein
MVCPECHAVEPLSRPIINAMRCRQPVPCTKCARAEMRFKVGGGVSWGAPLGLRRVAPRGGWVGQQLRRREEALVMASPGSRRALKPRPPTLARAR